MVLLATLTGIAQGQTCSGGAACAPVAGNFRFTNIDFPGATSTQASGINNRGQIVGFFHDAAGVAHGYLQDGDNLTSVEIPNTRRTFPSAISNSGAIVGGYSDLNRVIHGFILDHGTVTTVDFPGAILTTIIDINDRGDVVGAFENPDFGIHGFILDRNGLRAIDNPAETLTSTQAAGISNGKLVGGFFLDADVNFHGFTFSDGVFTSVDIPGAISTVLESLNDHGDIVGLVTFSDGIQHGYVQRDNRIVTVDFPGAVGSTFPLQMNDPGTVVGAFFDAQGVEHSFLAEPLQGGEGVAHATPVIQQAPARKCAADLTEHPELLKLPGACASAN